MAASYADAVNGNRNACSGVCGYLGGRRKNRGRGGHIGGRGEELGVSGGAKDNKHMRKAEKEISRLGRAVQREVVSGA